MVTDRYCSSNVIISYPCNSIREFSKYNQSTWDREHKKLLYIQTFVTSTYPPTYIQITYKDCWKRVFSLSCPFCSTTSDPASHLNSLRPSNFNTVITLMQPHSERTVCRHESLKDRNWPAWFLRQKLLETLSPKV